MGLPDQGHLLRIASGLVLSGPYSLAPAQGMHRMARTVLCLRTAPPHDRTTARLVPPRACTCAGSFWLNPPLPMTLDGDWINPQAQPAVLLDIDPPSS